MKKILLTIILIGLLIPNTIFSQGAERKDNILSNFEIESSCEYYNTSAVRIYKEGCYKGYTLIGNLYDPSSSSAELVNMEGKTVNWWHNVFPFPVKMLPDGEVLVGRNTESSTHNEGDIKEVSQVDWNGTVVWSFSDMFEYGNNKSARQHHDFQRESNPVGYYAPGQDFAPHGNTLILGHTNVNNTKISNKTLQDDVIYEVDWEGNPTGFIWYANEHFDEFGFSGEAKVSIYTHPGLVLPDVYWWKTARLEGFLENDWLHINTVSRLGKNKWYDEDPIHYSYFNPENLIIDSRHANFIAIIDYETGNIVWRVGPDYSNDAVEGQKIGQIIGPHNAHMVPDGLPGAGNILVFDNGGAAGYGNVPGQPDKYRNYSRVIEFNPVTKEIIWEYQNKKSEKVDLTFYIHWKWIRYGENHHFFSPYVSSAQRLPNGNTLITEGYSQRVFEVNPENEILWDYYKFLSFGIFYRAYRVPPDWVPNNSARYELWENNNQNVNIESNQIKTVKAVVLKNFQVVRSFKSTITTVLSINSESTKVDLLEKPDNGEQTNGTPGFEVISFIISVTIGMLLFQRKRLR